MILTSKDTKERKSIRHENVDEHGKGIMVYNGNENRKGMGITKKERTGLKGTKRKMVVAMRPKRNGNEMVTEKVKD